MIKKFGVISTTMYRQSCFRTTAGKLFRQVAIQCVSGTLPPAICNSYCPPIEPLFHPSPSRPTVGRWPQEVQTTRSGYGILQRMPRWKRCVADGWKLDVEIDDLYTFRLQTSEPVLHCRFLRGTPQQHMSPTPLSYALILFVTRAFLSPLGDGKMQRWQK